MGETLTDLYKRSARVNSALNEMKLYRSPRLVCEHGPVPVDPAHGFYEAALLSSSLRRIARDRSGRRIGRVKPIKCDQSVMAAYKVYHAARYVVPIYKLNVAISRGWFT